MYNTISVDPVKYLDPLWRAVCVVRTGLPHWIAHWLKCAAVLAKQLHDPLLLVGDKMDDLHREEHHGWGR